jgi:hypothetical protein
VLRVLPQEPLEFQAGVGQRLTEFPLGLGPLAPLLELEQDAVELAVLRAQERGEQKATMGLTLRERAHYKRRPGRSPHGIRRRLTPLFYSL